VLPPPKAEVGGGGSGPPSPARMSASTKAVGMRYLRCNGTLWCRLDSVILCLRWPGVKFGQCFPSHVLSVRELSTGLPQEGGWLLVTPLGILTIVSIHKWQALHVWPGAQQTIPGVFQPPEDGTEILNNVQRFLDYHVTQGYVTRPCGLGPAELRARRCTCDRVEETWGKLVPICPGQDIFLDRCSPPGVLVQGIHFPSGLTVYGRSRAGARE